MIRLAALILLALAVWRFVARRSRQVETITIGWDDGSAHILGADDPLRAEVLAIADRVVP